MMMEDTNEKYYEEIISLLVAAGYFRARIKGLSAFDKIAGGMTWCLQTISDPEADTEDDALIEDLLFRENSSIGTQIQLTEKIVAALQRLKCPHEIEPHQIQGETDFLHIFPVVQWLVKRGIEARNRMKDFHRAFALRTFRSQHCIRPSHSPTINPLLESLRFTYGKQLPLLDYGRFNPNGNEGDEERDEMEEIVRVLEIDNDALKSEIGLMKNKTSQLKSQIQDAEVVTDSLKSKLSSLQVEENDLNPKTAEERKVSMELMSLISKSETLKREEKEFKKSCNEKLTKMHAENEKLIRDIKALHESPKVKEREIYSKALGDLRNSLAVISRKVAFVERKIDDIPSKIELTQYHKRFVELEENLESKGFESRKFNASFGVLRELKTFITNQIKNFENILESCPEANSTGRHKFMNDLEAVMNEVKRIQEMISERNAKENDKKIVITEELNVLIEYYRKYSFLVRDFQDLLTKNETLTKKLGELELK